PCRGRRLLAVDDARTGQRVRGAERRHALAADVLVADRRPDDVIGALLSVSVEANGERDRTPGMRRDVLVLIPELPGSDRRSDDPECDGGAHPRKRDMRITGKKAQSKD